MANHYHLFGDGLAGRNLALPGTVDANARDLERVLAFAEAAGIPTVFVLPGIVNPGQSRDDAARVAAESLTRAPRRARRAARGSASSRTSIPGPRARPSCAA